MKRWFGGLFLVGMIPVLFYSYQFGFGLWEENEDWAYLGSFIGGVLGPVFTLMSVVLLIMTLKETQSANKAQLDLASRQYFDNYFFNSLTALKLSLESPKYGKELRVGELDGNFFTEASLWVTNNFKIHKHTDLNEDAWETAKNYIRKHPSIFDSEVTLLIPLLLKIKDMPQDERDKYLTLINGVIDNQKRFWLEVYSMVWSLELKFTLKNLQFSTLPNIIQDKVFEIENERE